MKASSHHGKTSSCLPLSPIFVRFPQHGLKRQVQAQAVVLASLMRPEVQPKTGAGLVLSTSSTTSMSTPHSASTKAYTNDSTSLPVEPWIRLQVCDDTSTLRDMLFHDDAYLYHPDVIKVRDLYIDRRHLSLTVCAWESMSTLTRYLVTASALQSTHSWAITVNFSATMLERLDNDPHPLRHLRNQISSLAKLGDLILAMERTHGGRLHAHGILRSEASVVQIRAALRNLGGSSCNTQWRNGFQVNVRPLHDCLGWTLYMLKSLYKLPPAEIQKCVHVSRNANRRARAHVAPLHACAGEKFGRDALRRRRLACSRWPGPAGSRLAGLAATWGAYA